jgi:hypothetical protein
MRINRMNQIISQELLMRVLKITLLLTIASMIALSTMVFADGGDDKVRPITAKEKMWMSSTWKSAMAALPSPPRGWERKEEAPPALKEVSETSPYPIPMDGWVRYEKSGAFNTADISESSDAMEQMMDKLQPLMEKMQAAVQKGDQREIQRLQSEMVEVQRGNKGLKSMEQKHEAAEMQRVAVTVSVNSIGFHIDDVKEIKSPKGVTAAFCSDPSTRSAFQKDVKDTVITLFIGKFTKKGGPKDFQVYCKMPGGAYTVVHSLIIAVKARDGKMAEEFLKKTNTQALAAMIR